MQIPKPPEVVPLTRLSPSHYEAGRACKARLAWMTSGRRSELPDRPKALLGICFHEVVKGAAMGRLPTEDEERTGAAAREMFDESVRIAYERAHPIFRVKYSSPEVLPFYYLFRERAALVALRVAGRRESTSRALTRPNAGGTPRRLIERWLSSRDGLLFGRPDYVDLQASEILDYKTGASGDDADVMSPAEARQLRLYVHLALENDFSVSRGVIVRPDGRRAESEMTKLQADAEGRQAREVLQQFNQSAHRPFHAIAEPSVEACSFCPCIPFCEPFWRDAAPAWIENCGTHVEGVVTAITETQVQDISVLTFDLEVRRGTVDAKRAFVEQVPESWTTTGGSQRPVIGQVLRVVHGRAISPGPAPVIRIDRTLTALWTIPHEGITS